MIVKMKKITFLVYHQEYASFLDAIRERGILHVSELGGVDSSNSVLREKVLLLNRINTATKFLQKEEVEAQPVKIDGMKVLHDLEALRREHEVAEQSIQALEKDLHQLEPWGNFSWEQVEKLRESGWKVGFYSCSARRWEKKWEEEFNAFEIGRVGMNLYFITVTPETQEMTLDADLARLPETSISRIETQISALRKDEEKIGTEYKRYAAEYLPALEELKLKVQEEFDLDKVVFNTNAAAEDKVRVLEGFIPANEEADFMSFLNTQGIYYEVDEPTMQEKVPVLLKNNRFTRLFEMIGDLYAKPRYDELDLTPYLAPFYLLFFGFCFSDAGYGLLFVLGATWFKIKNPAHKSILSLIQLLGASTILFGVLGGTFFGIELYKTNLPIYRDLAKSMEASGITVQDIMFKASLGLGLIQILFGMFLRAVKLTKQFGFKYSISTLGWAFLILFSGINYYLSMKGMVAFGNVAYYIVAGLCGFGIFFMNTPGANPFVNFGTGLWDAYNTIVGGVGDLLSYVRLFALGLASAILGLVFNDLALKLVNPEAGLMMQAVGFVLMLFVLFVGHAINIFMSGLGSMVHPLRLTFVEFYKNAGFEGGGLPYSPFRKKTES